MSAENYLMDIKQSDRRIGELVVERVDAALEAR